MSAQEAPQARLAPRRCIVLGGSGALGRAVCRRLAAEGARVGFTYFQGEAAAAELTQAIPGIVARRADLALPGEAARVALELAEALGGVTALVHCAALGSTVAPGAFESLAELDEAGWDRLMAVNVRSAAFAVQAIAPLLRAATGPRNVVLIGSVDVEKPVPSPVGYAASKGALVGMSHALAKALGKDGVTVNVVAPGILEGGMSRSVPAKLRAEFLKHVNLKRVGGLDEVAETIAFFALRNRYVTAQTILVDGGL